MTNEQRSYAAFQEAIAFFGGVAAMASALGVRSHALRATLRRGKLSRPQALKVHELTGGVVHRESLRPDLFPTLAQRRRAVDKLLKLLREHCAVAPVSATS